MIINVASGITLAEYGESLKYSVLANVYIQDYGEGLEYRAVMWKAPSLPIEGFSALEFPEWGATATTLSELIVKMKETLIRTFFPYIGATEYDAARMIEATHDALESVYHELHSLETAV